MPVLNARQLHNQTSAILDDVAKGMSFDVERHGKVIATIAPAKDLRPQTWDEVLAPVRAALKTVTRKQPNPVLEERARRRR